MSENNNTGFDGFLASLPNVVDKTECFDPQDVQANKTVAILSSLGGLLTLIGWLISRDSKFNKFYVNQGIWATIVNLIPILGQLCWIVCVVSSIYGIVNGKYRTLPVVGGIDIVKTV